MLLTLTYSGTVESTDDPERIGRLKVRVPCVFGPASAIENSIPTDRLPWALPAGLPAGGTPASGAMQWLPNVGDHVYIRFLDGEPEKPIWEWGGQDRSQAAKFPHWRRNPGGYGSDGSPPPDSTAFLRHGHIVEISPGAVTAGTSHGYAMILTDAAAGGFGLITLLTAKGYNMEFDDNTDQLTIWAPNIYSLFKLMTFVGKDCTFTLSETFHVSAADVAIKAGIASLTSTLSTTIKAGTFIAAVAPRVALGTEETMDPVVRLSDLIAVTAAIMAQHNSHLHTGNLGRPTSPPTKPMRLEPTGSPITFSA